MSKVTNKKSDIKQSGEEVKELCCSLFMTYEETTIEEFRQCYYENEILHKWINGFPYMWATSDTPYCEKGCTATFHMFFSLLKFYVTCEEVLPDNQGFVLRYSGIFNGTGRFEFIKTDEGILHHHKLKVTGMNKIAEIGHSRYLNKKFKVLREMLIKQTLEKKLGEVGNGA